MKEVLTGRIIALDQLRGFLLAVIAIDHVARFPNPYEFLTGRGILWVSAAEGFFIISGLLVGYLYVKRMRAAALQSTLKIWKRAALLYGLSIFWTLIFTFVAWLLSNNVGVKPGYWQQHSDIGTFIFNLLTLQYVYGWADFLAYYAQFMLLAPLVVWLITKRLAWLAVIGSLVIWLLFQQQSFVLSWQPLFVLAIVAGAYLPAIESWVRHMPAWLQNVATGIITVSAASILTISAFVVIILPYMLNHQLLGDLQLTAQQLVSSFQAPGGVASWFVKEALPLPRIMLAFFVFAAFYILFRRYETWLAQKTKDFLTVIGRRSLFVYCLQAILIFAINLVVPQELNLVYSTLLTTIVLVALYSGARLRSKINLKPRFDFFVSRFKTD